MAVEPSSWSVVAANLPEHARNPIHTDAGAQAAGFPRALVAGVTTYAYLTHVPLVAWGLDWLATGGGELRLAAPVFDGDLLECRPGRGVDGTWSVAAIVGGTPARAMLSLAEPATASAPAPLRPGEELDPHTVRLQGEWGADYGRRAGDDLGLCADAGVVHPAVWPALANQVVHTQVARGSWIHVRSRITHHATASAGATAVVRAAVTGRTARRSGEWAVLDVAVEVDGQRVASLEHEAIVALPGS